MNLVAQRLGVSADNVIVTKLAGDASSRVYFRAEASATENGNPPSGLVMVIYPEPFDETESARDRLARLQSSNPAARLTYANDPMAHIELTALFLEAGLPVPKILSINGSRRLILFEDLGDLRLQDWLVGKTSAEVRRAYRNALELMVKIQDNTDRAVQEGSISSVLAFDQAKLEWELKFFLDNYFGQYVPTELPASTRAGIEEEISQLCDELASCPRALTHRDYHARNLMIHNDAMFIIDHQDARMGPRTYDLVSLLYDPYATLDQDIVDEMIDYYLELNAKSTVPYDSKEEFRLESELAIAQRLLKAAGTYAFQAGVRKNEVYIQYLPPALETALGALERLGRFENLRGLIESTLE